MDGTSNATLIRTKIMHAYRGTLLQFPILEHVILGGTPHPAVATLPHEDRMQAVCHNRMHAGRPSVISIEANAHHIRPRRYR